MLRMSPKAKVRLGPRALLLTLLILSMGLLLQSQSTPHPAPTLVGTNLQVHQSFGICSETQVDTLFQNYPQACNDAYSNLTVLLQQGTQIIIGEKELKEVYKIICEDVCLKPVLNFSEHCKTADLIPPVSQLCEINQEKSEFCITALYKNNGTVASKACHGVEQRDRCPQDCESALRSMADDLGCCVNSLFNVSTYGFDALNVASYDLWAMCNVTSPGFCPSYSFGVVVVPSTTVTVVTVIAMVINYLQ